MISDDGSARGKTRSIIDSFKAYIYKTTCVLELATPSSKKYAMNQKCISSAALRENIHTKMIRDGISIK